MDLKKYLRRIMYRDKVDVSRTEIRPVGDSGAAENWFGKVLENVPCHLSTSGKELAAHRDDTSMKLTINLKLYCDPIYDIQPNDVLDVTHEGQEIQLHAGVVFKYPSHSEIECIRRKEAGQH